MKNYGKTGKNKQQGDESDQIITPVSEVKKLQIFIFNIQRQVQYQTQQIESLKRRFNFSITDGAAL